MLYLATPNTQMVRDGMTENPEDMGVFITPGMGNKVLPDVKWAGDNECFTLGKNFDGEKFVKWLVDKPVENCLFISAPDVVGDPVETLKRSVEWLPAIRNLGFPVAFIGQDGIENLLDSVPWDSFDAWFTGGSTEWKLSEDAAVASREAKRRGKWLHMGRVNSLKRMRYAKSLGYDSVDGTKISFAPDENFPKILRWIKKVNEESTLF